MTFMPAEKLGRGGYIRAIYRRIFRRILRRISRANLKPPRQAAPQPTDQVARDIGLSQTELERLRHKWPSQNTHHPGM